jgi:hypothetical protein
VAASQEGLSSMSDDDDDMTSCIFLAVWQLGFDIDEQG